MSSRGGGYPPLDFNVLKPTGKIRVAYMYDEDGTDHTYRAEHPMQPVRVKMAHSLIVNTGISKKLETWVSITPSMTEHAL